MSCVSASACIAVGYNETQKPAPHSVSLAERWDGTHWVIQATPNLTGAQPVGLLGVSCVSASACAAVGVYPSISVGWLPLAERWDGTSWAIQITAGAHPQSELNGVSCASAYACTAVGQYVLSTAELGSLAERWDGNA